MKTLKSKIVLGLILLSFFTVLTLTLFTTFNTRELFNTYLDDHRITRQEQWARVLEGYYSSRGSWSGINHVLHMSGDHHRGMGRGRAASGEIIILTDTDGKILISSDRMMQNKGSLSLEDLNNAEEIIVDGTIVGYIYLIIEPEIPGLATLENRFINSVFYSNFLAGIIIAIIAAFIGIGFSKKLVQPIKQLTRSAKDISQGHWKVGIDLKREDELGELAKTFVTMARKLEMAEKVRQTLVADVAHELRNPLATIRAQLESIQEGVTKPEPNVILSLNDEVIRLNKLVNDLQDLSLAEVGKLKLDKQPTDFEELIKKVTNNFEGMIREKNLNLNLNLDFKSKVYLDLRRMTQVLVNLISNAVRHTPEGKNIDITLREIEDGLYLEIINDGKLIPSEDLPHIFERFYRADKGRAREMGGTGLGLAITKGLVEAHGGTVGAENFLNRVKFFIYLPKK